jgi:cytochrome P450
MVRRFGLKQERKLMSSHAGVVQKVPAHVPKELVWDKSFDAFTAELGDPYLAISRLHNGPGIIWATDASYGRPGWVATRNDLISEVFIDHEHFSAERPGMIADLLGVNLRLNPIEIDPPAHHGFRRILNPFFTPKAVSSLDEPVRQACQQLIGKFEDKGGCEFIGDFAAPFPSYVFLDVMGMPHEKLPDFIKWENALMRGRDIASRGAAARSIYRYLEEFLEEQRKNPGNDLIKAIVTGEVDGRPLEHLETMGMLYVLYVGGLDTVYSTLGWVMRHLATHPDLQERLRGNPEQISAAVEEFARAFSVVVTHRAVAEDFTFHGVPMRKGDEINLPISLANRDPSVHANPHVVDIDRKPRHINFGTGVHFCLAIHLAKREIRIVVEEFLKRFRNIRIRKGESYRYHTGRTFGIDYLPLVWD